MVVYLFLLSFCVFTNVYPVLTQVTELETPRKTKIVIAGDMHSSCDPTLPLCTTASKQVTALKESFRDYRFFAELPRGGTNNNVLSLLKNDGQSLDLENRGVAVDALGMLERRRRNWSPPTSPCDTTLADVSKHYNVTLGKLKERYYREPILSPLCSQTFEEIPKHHYAFCTALKQKGFTPDDSIAKLYDIERPLGMINLLHDTWRKLFDLHAMHTVYTHAQQNTTNALVCVGTKHAEPLRTWFSQIEGYLPGYKQINHFSGDDSKRLVQEALTEINIKKAAGLLSSGCLGTLSGYVRYYSKYLCPGISADSAS